VQDPVIADVNRAAVFEYAAYCAVPPDPTRSALSYAQTGFAYVERNCGVFFDKLAELTQAGRFATSALNATNLGAQSILFAARVAAQNVAIVGASVTLTEAIFNAFVQQYAFSPYLYKIRELTWQAFSKHVDENSAALSHLKSGFRPDDYCDAFILIQQHASLCTISNVQMLFDQQVALATKVVRADEKAGLKMRFMARGVPRYSPILSPPNYTVQ
jgi:hypothetical protein